MASCPCRWTRWTRRLLPLAVYAALVVWLTWPVVVAPTSRLAVGTEPVATVPLFNLWTMWWNVDRLGHGFAGYWDAPIFHPTGDALLFSEVQPLTVVLAPVVWLTGSRVLAYNVWLWLSLLLNGVFAERLLRGLGVRRSVAVAGGAGTILLPIVHWQLGVEQLAPVWGILWTWDAARRATVAPTWWRGAVVGGAFSVAYHLCGHHGLFLSVLLLAGGLVLPGERLFCVRGLVCWASAGVAAAALVGPFVWKHHAVFAEHESFARPEHQARGLSLEPSDYTRPKWPQLVNVGHLGPNDRRGWGACPGWIKVGLAVVGIGFGLWRRRWRRFTLWLLLVAGLAFALSLGPRLEVRGWTPWSLLVDHYPGFEQVRNVFRFAYFVQMAVVLFAAVGGHHLWVLARRRTPRGRWRRAAVGTVALLGVAAVLEIRPAPPTTFDVPPVAPHRAWLDFVRTETPADAAILCVPMAAGRAVEDFETTTRWMYLATFHGRPLVNGYSGFFPRPYNETQSAVNRSFPTHETLRQLVEWRVEFVVVDRTIVPAEALAFVWFDDVLLQHVFADDEAAIDVYRVQPR